LLSAGFSIIGNRQWQSATGNGNRQPAMAIGNRQWQSATANGNRQSTNLNRQSAVSKSAI
jgi:hypothetical protein